MSADTKPEFWHKPHIGANMCSQVKATPRFDAMSPLDMHKWLAAISTSPHSPVCSMQTKPLSNKHYQSLSDTRYQGIFSPVGSRFSSLSLHTYNLFYSDQKHFFLTAELEVDVFSNNFCVFYVSTQHRHFLYNFAAALNVSACFLVLLTRNGAFPVKHWYTIVPMLHRSALAS